MELQDYKHRVNDKRYIEVEIECEYCHQLYWAKWSKVNKGLAKFCSRKCSSLYRADSLPSTVGKENARKNFDEKTRIWKVYWRDENNKLHSSTLAKWLWEQDGRTIPPKHVVYYKDGDSKNCVLENLVLMSRTEFNSMLLMGHAISDETKQKIGKSNSGKIRTQEHKDKISIGVRKTWKSGTYNDVHVGESHRLWKGGNKPYPKEFNMDLRSTVKLRDDNKCQICGKSVSGRHGQVHHIDGDKKNNSMDNLILLCASCHSKIHLSDSDREDKIYIFRSKLKV